MKWIVHRTMRLIWGISQFSMPGNVEFAAKLEVDVNSLCHVPHVPAEFSKSGLLLPFYADGFTKPCIGINCLHWGKLWSNALHPLFLRYKFENCVVRRCYIFNTFWYYNVFSQSVLSGPIEPPKFNQAFEYSNKDISRTVSRILKIRPHSRLEI